MASTPDPAQQEWERTQALDEGVELNETVVTGRDPAELPDADDEIPFEDIPAEGLLPETQDDDPVTAELGEDGQGDLSPEDL
ncbi:sugar ABC transporter ATPase [Microbacterium paludicola]|uniref:sugar ABC transporter ATPase n=1 Tax=Microbacterium paludicola TaxID=300019 RepID=UPI0011A85E52|nr:sugar ABC transporter ATPase [Microbacterium paludicola]